MKPECVGRSLGGDDATAEKAAGLKRHTYHELLIKGFDNVVPIVIVGAVNGLQNA